jgi:hypothetical protein
VKYIASFFILESLKLGTTHLGLFPNVSCVVVVVVQYNTIQYNTIQKFNYVLQPWYNPTTMYNLQHEYYRLLQIIVSKILMNLI